MIPGEASIGEVAIGSVTDPIQSSTEAIAELSIGEEADEGGVVSAPITVPAAAYLALIEDEYLVGSFL